MRQIEAVNAQTGPVMLAYPTAPQIDALLARAAAGNAAVDVTADDGVRHQLWVIDDDATIAALTRAVDALPALYIADGHHRSAAAARVAKARGGEGSHDYFLAVLFPQHEMTILDYNRVLRDLNGRTPEALLARIARALRGRAERSAGPARRRRRGRHVPCRALVPSPVEARARGRGGRRDDPIGRLPITLLTRNIIEPIFGITDPRTDKRIDFVGGGRGSRVGAARLLRRHGRRLRALPDADERPDGGRRRRQDHAAEIDLVRAQARRRHGEPRAGLIFPRRAPPLPARAGRGKG